MSCVVLGSRLLANSHDNNDADKGPLEILSDDRCYSCYAKWGEGERCTNCPHTKQEIQRALAQAAHACNDAAFDAKRCCDNPEECLFGATFGSDSYTSMRNVLTAAAGGVQAIESFDKESEGTVSKVCETLATAAYTHGATTMGLAAYCFVTKVDPCYDACSQEYFTGLVHMSDASSFFPNASSSDGSPLNISLPAYSSSNPEASIEAVTINSLQTYKGFLTERENLCSEASSKARAWGIQGAVTIGAGGLASYCANKFKEKKKDKEESDSNNSSSEGLQALEEWEQYCQGKYSQDCQTCQEPRNINTPECSKGPPAPGSYQTSNKEKQGGSNYSFSSEEGKLDPTSLSSRNFDPFDPTSNSGSSANSSLSSQQGGQSGGSRLKDSRSASGTFQNSHSDTARRSSETSGSSDFGFRSGGGGGFGSGGRSVRRQSKGFNLRDFLPGGRKDPRKKTNPSSGKRNIRKASLGPKEESLFERHSNQISNLCKQRQISCSR